MNQCMTFSSPTSSNLFAESSTINKLLLIAAGVLVLAIASQINIPLLPVPLTFQSATVILIAMAYGSKNGAYVIAAYLFAGVCGLPVFAEFSFGPAKLMGPTSGYLLGFLPAAYVSGLLAERGLGRNILTSFVTAMIGAAIIFACGLPVLATFMGWNKAIEFGLMPFIVTEPIKLFAVSLLIPRLWKKS